MLADRNNYFAWAACARMDLLSIIESKSGLSLRREDKQKNLPGDRDILILTGSKSFDELFSFFNQFILTTIVCSYKLHKFSVDTLE